MDEFSTKITTGGLTAKQQEIGTRWRRLPASRQALLALAHQRCGDTYAQLATGFGIGVATVYRYIREAVEALSAPSTEIPDGSEGWPTVTGSVRSEGTFGG